MSLKTPLAHNRLKRNAFDLSERHLFTGSIGELLPCYVKECVPGDKFVIKPQVFLRTMPMQTASFVRLKQTVEFFKVPFRLLWSRFPQFIAGTSYNTSTYFNTKGFFGLPMISLYSQKVAANIGESESLVDYMCRCDRSNQDNKNLFGVDSIQSTCKLLDLLGYGLYNPDKPDTIPSHKDSMLVSPFRILAYNKIYQDFYRNPLYEDQDANSFNIDFLDKGDSSVPFDIFNREYRTSFSQSYDRMFKLHYRNLKSDYFTNIRPTFAGAIWQSALPAAPIFPVTGSAGNMGNFTANIYNYQSLLGKGDNIDFTRPDNDFGFTINNLRSAYALDKLLDNTSRSKDGCYVHQMETRFGVKPRVDDFHCSYLGGSDAPVQIGEVVSQSQTSDQPLGTIGGKAMSFNNGNIEVECDEHCIIMGIISIVPETDYPAYGVDREVQKKYKEEFFTPEFMDLGFQPTTYSELFASYVHKSDLSANDDSFVLGWNPRYAEYKTGIDKVHGDLNRDGSLSMWCAPYTSWTAEGNHMNIEALKINPSLFDTLFYVNYNGSSKNDQFLFNSNFDVKAIRPMSISGLPYAD